MVPACQSMFAVECTTSVVSSEARRNFSLLDGVERNQTLYLFGPSKKKNMNTSLEAEQLHPRYPSFILTACVPSKEHARVSEARRSLENSVVSDGHRLT